MAKFNRYSTGEWVGIGLLMIFPVIHPIGIPWIGVASHLLWWVHVLPVALVTHRYGRRGALVLLGLSAGSVLVGERILGAGYGVPADWHTTLSLTAALTFTHLLVIGFALYARTLLHRYQMLFEGSEVAIVRTDDEGRVLALNPAARRILGAHSSVVGASYRTLPGLDSIPPLEEIQKSGGWIGAVDLSGSGRGPLTLHLGVVVMRHDEPLGHHLLMVDRTLEVAQQSEMERQARLAALGEGLAGVAHEIRSPLSIISLYAEMVQNERNPEEKGSMMAEIRTQVERIVSLSEELLGFSRAPGKTSTVELGPFLRKKIRMESLSHGPKIKWIDRIQWEGDVPVPAGRLEQILANLLGNAVDALEGEKGCVEVRSWAEDGFVYVEVADSGPGIDPELGESIFHPFVTGKRERGGTGLGLPISRRLARAFGGDLTARNRRAGGAAFLLSIPLDPSPDRVSGPASQLAEPAEHPEPTAPDHETQSRPDILQIR